MADRVAQLATHLNYPRGMLAGQVAIVTGSGQGIGAETARLFANEGAKVVVADIDAGKLTFVILEARSPHPLTPSLHHNPLATTTTHHPLPIAVALDI